MCTINSAVFWNFDRRFQVKKRCLLTMWPFFETDTKDVKLKKDVC